MRSLIYVILILSGSVTMAGATSSGGLRAPIHALSCEFSMEVQEGELTRIDVYRLKLDYPRLQQVPGLDASLCRAKADGSWEDLSHIVEIMKPLPSIMMFAGETNPGIVYPENSRIELKYHWMQGAPYKFLSLMFDASKRSLPEGSYPASFSLRASESIQLRAQGSCYADVLKERDPFPCR